REVIMIPVRELDIGGLLAKPEKELNVRDITMEDFKKTLKKVKPMTTESELKKYDDWKNEFGE
ncbi:MAG TPA: hypothetical protein VGB37_16900, partial [Candidatus Lokiarchaeia archaeon]